jgi:DNA-binding CsgD family transcriptional regulator
VRLSHKDFDALQRAILELYEYRDPENFRQAAIRIFLRLIPADHFCKVCYDINPRNGSAKMIEYYESYARYTPEIIHAMEELVWDHPYTHYFMEGGEMMALKFSDFFTQAQLDRSPMAGLVPAAFERHNLTSPVDSKKGTAALSLTRRRRDFSERDRMIMNLLQPHFNQAQRNAELAAAARAKSPSVAPLYKLSPREREIAHWLGRGKTNSETATILRISVRTVEKHMEKILEKLGVENRASAIVALFETGPKPEAGTLGI